MLPGAILDLFQPSITYYKMEVLMGKKMENHPGILFELWYSWENRRNI